MSDDIQGGEGGVTTPAVAKTPGRFRARLRFLLSHLATAGFAFVFAVAASWYVQPRVVKAREDTARWETLIHLAKMPAEQREQLFREAIALDGHARDAARQKQRQPQGGSQ